MYEQWCATEGINLLPVAVDNLGGWQPFALVTIKKLGRQLARKAGREDEKVVRPLRQRLSVRLVRDNVAMLCSRTLTYVHHVWWMMVLTRPDCYYCSKTFLNFYKTVFLER